MGGVYASNGTGGLTKNEEEGVFKSWKGNRGSFTQKPLPGPPWPRKKE